MLLVRRLLQHQLRHLLLRVPRGQALVGRLLLPRLVPQRLLQMPRQVPLRAELVVAAGLREGGLGARLVASVVAEFSTIC